LSTSRLSKRARQARGMQNDVDKLESILDAALILLTGCRLSEIMTLRWDEVDLENHWRRKSETLRI